MNTLRRLCPLITLAGCVLFWAALIWLVFSQPQLDWLAQLPH